jgi:inhibitor of KinA sporulation pathway (predicted exonuclease)
MVAFAAWVQSVAGTATPVFVGFNAGFDWAFVNWYFHHFMGDNPFGISALDIKSYFMGLAGVAWSDTRSSKLPKRYQEANTGGHSHNALDDAVEQASIFARMLADARTS